MTENTKSFIKHTILGLLGGGTASALYAMHSIGGDKKPDQSKDEIVVPLSKSHFMKSVRGGKKDTAEASEEAVVGDTSSMSPRDLAALKKALLKKKASDKCLKVNATESVQKREVPVRRIAGAGSTFPRDRKGRFVAEKEAGILSDAGGTIADSLGWIGGTAAGLVAVKMISDRIRINKKKRQVEESRQRYIDTLAKEVNDVDAPYYSKTAADRGLIGSTLGLMGLAGLVTGTTAGIVMYRIMENRRKELEKAKDKDLNSYPKEKTIKFRFPNTGYDNSGFFG